MAEYFIVAGLQLQVRREQLPSATSLYLFGAAGFVAAVNYSYFAMDGFTSCADNFCLRHCQLGPMAEYFIVAGYKL
jgi:hypothetical protein